MPTPRVVPDHTYPPFHHDLEVKSNGEVAPGPAVCLLCGHYVGDHIAQWEVPTPELQEGLVEARFPGQGWRGLYCPRPVVDTRAL